MISNLASCHNSRMSDSLEDRVVTVVQRLLAEHSIDGPIRPDDNLLEIGLNSLDILNLVLSLEVEFGLTIPEIDITPTNLLSISGISRLLATLLNR